MTEILCNHAISTMTIDQKTAEILKVNGTQSFLIPYRRKKTGVNFSWVKLFVGKKISDL